MIIFQILGTIILSAISGTTYRCGGAGGKYPFWIREVGVTSCLILGLILLGYFHWTLILTAGAMYGITTTYFGFVNPWIGRKKDEKFWLNWLLVGIGFSIAILPIILVYHNWFGFGIRSAVCMFLVVAWSEANNNVVWEEFGRGAIPIITLPLLLL